MNYLAVIAQHEAEERRLERLGWTLKTGVDQTAVAAIPVNRGKHPPGTKYHWTSQTLLVPPSKD